MQDNEKLKPQISKYDVKGSNIELMKINMKEFDWESTIDNCQSVEDLNEMFAKALCTIADKSEVPMFKDKTKKGFNINTQVSNTINKLNTERVKLDKLLVQEHTREADATRFRERITAINEEIEKRFEEERERHEKKVCERIAEDPKAFFQYANSVRKNKTKIGPLKSGSNYLSGEKEMAEAEAFT